jgi:hypothetical protein
MVLGGKLASQKHSGILEFLGAATAHTHEMMVVAVSVTGQFVTSPPLRKLQLLKQLHRTEQPQGAVHRGQRHPFLLAEEALMNLLGAQVAAGSDLLKQAEHPLALGGEPLPPVMEGRAQ